MQGREADVLQRNGSVLRDCQVHIMTDLSRVREDSRETLKVALAELDDVVLSPCLKVLNDIVPKIRGEDERIWMSVTNEQIVSRRAVERITPGCA